MKKLFILAAVAALSAGLVFVACKKEETNIDKVANEQVVKHQKIRVLVMTKRAFSLFLHFKCFLNEQTINHKEQYCGVLDFPG